MCSNCIGYIRYDFSLICYILLSVCHYTVRNVVHSQFSLVSYSSGSRARSGITVKEHRSLKAFDLVMQSELM